MPASAINLVIFQIGPVPCGVDSNSVLTVIEPPPHITAIPGSNAFRPGLFSYSQKPVAVYDVRTKFNLPTDQRGKIIIAEMNQQFFGFWVDCIQEIIGTDKGKSQILPAECPKELFESLFILKNQLIFKTNFEALAKAQVSTQTHQFIAKLVSESKEKISAENTKLKHQKKVNATSVNTPQNKTNLTKENKRSTTAKTTSTFQDRNKKNLKQETTPVKKTDSFVRPIIGEKENPAPISTKQPGIHSRLKTTPDILDKTRPVVNKTATISTKAQQQSIFNQTSPKQIREKISEKKYQHENINNQTPAKHNETHAPTGNKYDNETTSGDTGTFILFAVLLIFISGSLYWLFIDEPSPQRKSKIVKMDSKIKSPEKIPATIDHDLQAEDKEEINESESHDLISTPATITETQPIIELIPDQNDIDNVSSEPEFQLNSEFAEDSANIQKTGDTIIITLSGNDAYINNETKDIEDNQITNPDTQDSEKEQPVIDNNSATSPAEVIEIKIEEKTAVVINKNKNPVPDIITEVIHIVVKGDTLWHIAKRYIHDPYKYHELARLSKIKNPDLIYPGNKVIIRIKNNNKTSK